MEQAQANIGKMHVVAPMDGLVALEKNEGASGGFFFEGMSLRNTARAIKLRRAEPSVK